MKKKLYLMRHSEANSYACNDFERELTQYGKNLAKKNSLTFKDYLEEYNIKLEHCFYSSSKRTTETYDIFSKVISSNFDAVKTRALYLTGIKELKEIFKSYSNKIENKENIVVIAHNFGISHIASILTGNKIYMDVADIVPLEISLPDSDVSWKNLLDFEGSWDIVSF